MSAPANNPTKELFAYVSDSANSFEDRKVVLDKIEKYVAAGADLNYSEKPRDVKQGDADMGESLTTFEYIMKKGFYRDLNFVKNLVQKGAVVDKPFTNRMAETFESRLHNSYLGSWERRKQQKLQGEIQVYLDDTQKYTQDLFEYVSSRNIAKENPDKIYNKMMNFIKDKDVNYNFRLYPKTPSIFELMIEKHLLKGVDDIKYLAEKGATIDNSTIEAAKRAIDTAPPEKVNLYQKISKLLQERVEAKLKSEAPAISQSEKPKSQPK